MSEDPPEDPGKLLHRMDLISVDTEIIEEAEEGDNDNTKFAGVLKPNPERYDWIDEDDRKGWLDTFDDTFYPQSVIAEAWEQIDGTPIYHSPPEIDDLDSYIEERRETIQTYLDCGSLSYDFDNESTAVLRDLSKKGNPLFVIMVVDIVGSTDMNIAMHPSAYAVMVQSFINEIRLLVRKHTGYVLKYTGDGLIAYFSEPNITGKHDNAIQCATRIPTLLNDVLNPVLNEFDMPSLQFRVGLDTGSAEIFPGAQNSQDLLGTTVSLAAKIESTANTNEILMGDNTERNLHTDWRKRTRDVTAERDWEYSIDEDIYSIYTIS